MSIINPYKPKVLIQELDATGTPTGTAVDVSCDIQDVTPDVDIPSTTVQTFCGSATLVGEPEESFDVTVVVRDETDANWTPLVGKSVRVQFWDRATDERHREFDSLVVVNPSLYGSTAPGEARTVSFQLPVLSPLVWADGAYTEPVMAMAGPATPGDAE